MSTIRYMIAGQSTAVAVDGTQANYDAGIVALTALGGIMEVGPGNEALSAGTIPSTVSVVWFRNDGTVTWYNPIWQLTGTSGSSMTLQLRSAAQSRIRLGTLLADLCQWNCNGTDTFFDWAGILNFRFGFNGTVKATMTSSRFDLKSGMDLAFNGLPGSGGQIPVSQGAAASPLWSTLAGITSGSQSFWWFPAQAFTIDDSGFERLFYRDAGSVDTGYTMMGQYGGASDVFTGTTMVVPPRYASTASWKVYLTTNGTSTNPMVVRFGLAKWADGSTAANAYTVTDNSWSPGGTADILKVLTVTTPTITLAPGDIFKVMVERRASSDAGDTNADTMNMLGVLLTFNT